MKLLKWIAIILLIFTVTGCQFAEPSSKEKKVVPEEVEKALKQLLTDKEVERLSEKSTQIIESLGATGAAPHELKKLDDFLTELDKYDYGDNEHSYYVENLAISLQAIKSYASGTAEEKELGKVYPDYLAALNGLKEKAPSLQLKEPSEYQWFYAAAAAYEQGRKNPGEITLTFVGDNSFGTYPETPEHLKFDHVFKENKGDDQYVFKNSLPWFNSDDYTVINAESAFTNETRAVKKMWRIKSDPAYVSFLPASGVEAANLANNHTRDYFEVGYEDTLEAFRKHDIAVFNDGQLLITKIGEIETIFLGYDCRVSQQSTKFRDRIVQEVKQYKRPDNLVIVNMHWGVEYRETPVWYQTNFGRAIIDAGADIIMGAHPHRLQSVELYNDKYIIYSMGDYAFGADPTLHSRQTAMFRVKFAMEDNIVVMKGLTIVPTLENSDGSTTENNYQPLPVYGKDAEEIVNELTRISTKIENGVAEFDYFDPF